MNRMDRAFEARFEEIRTHKGTTESIGTVTRDGRIYRDGAGRIRQEIRTVSKSGDIVAATSIFDPVAREVFFLVGSPPQLVKQMKLPSDWSLALPNDWRPSIAERAEPAGDVVVDDLGAREIEGMICHGRRVRAGSEEAETWVSDELLDQPVWIRAVTPTEEYTFKLFGIHRREPEAGLFRPPE